jgi:ankyrin repeat protein
MLEDLMKAIRTDDAAAVERLAAPDTVNAADAEGMTPLMLAAQCGAVAVASTLIARGAAVNAADERGFTALFRACWDADTDCGHPEVVELLIGAGADKEACIGFGVRPLMYAAGNGEAAVVETLLRLGADPLARNEAGRTALIMVKDRNYVDVINILHEAEALLEAGSCGSRNAPDMQVITFRKPPPRPA